MKVVIAAEAQAEIISIGEYVAQENPNRAVRLMAELRLSCNELAEMPERFSFVPRYERLGVRRRVVGNYLIFYRNEPDRVVVLHIVHGAMDYLHLLFPN